MSSKKKENLFAAGFLLPVFVIYTVFLFLPLVNTAFYSLTKWNGVTDKVFTGIKNYQELFYNSDHIQEYRQAGRDHAGHTDSGGAASGLSSVY